VESIVCDKHCFQISFPADGGLEIRISLEFGRSITELFKKRHFVVYVNDMSMLIYHLYYLTADDLIERLMREGVLSEGLFQEYFPTDVGHIALPE